MKLLVFAFASAVLAQLATGSLERVQQVSREQLAEFEHQPKGVSIAVTGESANPVVHVVSDGSAPAEIGLVTIKHPSVNTAFYALRGEIRYADVASDGYLEMYVWFGEATSYFSRSLAEQGPVGKIANHSDWRGFCLPFNSATIPSSPTKLVLNLKLPGRGDVTIRNLRLEQAASMDELLAGQDAPQPTAPHAAEREGMADRSAGMIGGLAGAVIGCLGSLLEFLASRGRARGFVLGTACTLAGLGAACIGGGIMALATAQVREVAQVLLLLGVLCAVIFPLRLRHYLRQYRQTELRRIDSLDAVGV